jgi:hypothetical protein
MKKRTILLLAGMATIAVVFILSFLPRPVVARRSAYSSSQEKQLKRMYEAVEKEYDVKANGFPAKQTLLKIIGPQDAKMGIGYLMKHNGTLIMAIVLKETRYGTVATGIDSRGTIIPLPSDLEVGSEDMILFN